MDDLLPVGVWGLDTSTFDRNAPIDWLAMRRDGLRWITGSADFWHVTWEYHLNWVDTLAYAKMRQASRLAAYGVPIMEYWVIE